MSDKKLDQLFRIDNQVVVITGATGLLGRKHAEVVAAYGGIPILLDLNQAVIDDFAKELEDKYNVPATGMVVDITNEASIAENCAFLLKKFGTISGLINNAANNPKVEDAADKNFSRLENFPIDIWNQDIAVGLTGAFLCAKHYGNAIANNPAGGSIVNISSDLGLIAPDQRLYLKDGLPEEKQAVKPVTYSVVKTALLGLTRYLATYWADKNVRCNALCPGGIENGQDSAFLAELHSRIPMGRMASADEYQGVVIFMLSQASAYLNGAVIPVDGGRTTW
ncbi:MAG: SDR family oxidoreductase [Gammaproteobacteria bacterium]|nr:SDR family oxidoreductase [Gammaproteobacteria bacterium]